MIPWNAINHFWAWIFIECEFTLISNVTQTNKLSQRKNEKGIGYRGGQKYYNFCCKLKNDDSFRHDTYMTINREAKGPLNHGLSVARYLQKNCQIFANFTMLQKLWKCEVKAWLCWKWWFYSNSDFTWNQIFASSNSPKMSFLAILETLNFEFFKVNLELESCSN